MHLEVVESWGGNEKKSKTRKSAMYTHTAHVLK